MSGEPSYAASYDEECRGARPYSTTYLQSSIAVIIVGGITILGSLFVFTSNASASFRSVSNFARPLNMNEANSLSFTLQRVNYAPLPYFSDKYKAENIAQYKFLSDYTAVIEPYADMQLFFYDGGNSDSVYTYEVCESLSDGKSCQSRKVLNYGTTSVSNEGVYFQCTAHDKYEISVTEYNNDESEILQQTKSSAICMYVRREIRSLTQNDLQKYLMASAALDTMSEQEGQEKFGSNYHDSSYLTKYHYFHSAWQSADHFHEGNGFLMQHVKLTNMFETIIQSVDPSVSVPYWDFTIDQAKGLSVSDSFVVGNDKYGSMPAPSNGVYFTYHLDPIESTQIPDGRWASTKAALNTEFADLPSPYGYLRSPWNLNPNPYLTRSTLKSGLHTDLPTCQTHYQTLGLDTFTDFVFDIQLKPHGATHVNIGGIYGCDALQPMLLEGYLESEGAMLDMCSNWFIITKELYRYNYILPKTECKLDSDDLRKSSCGYTCPNRESLFQGLRSYTDYVNFHGAPTDARKKWTSFFCGGDAGKIFSGDHLESSSPADPSFWVIHPTLERLFHAKLMSGGFVDSSWPTDQKESYVCSKAKCYVNNVFAYHSECCYGHYENDAMYDAINGDKASFVGPTNSEIMKGTDPQLATYSMPYIYDEFSWSHCDVDFDELLSRLSEMTKNGETNKEFEKTHHYQTVQNEKLNIIQRNRDHIPNFEHDAVM